MPVSETLINRYSDTWSTPQNVDDLLGDLQECEQRVTDAKAYFGLVRSREEASVGKAHLELLEFIRVTLLPIIEDAITRTFENDPSRYRQILTFRRRHVMRSRKSTAELLSDMEIEPVTAKDLLLGISTRIRNTIDGLLVSDIAPTKDLPVLVHQRSA